MNKGTVIALKQLNQKFYEDYSANFSSTRILPWAGWRRVLDLCLQTWRAKATDNPTSILDVGCGNGRFGQLLDQEFTDPFDYHGLDNSAELLAVAAQRLRPGPRGDRTFQKVDLTSSEFTLSDIGVRFQFITVLGLLHHIPGLHTRQALIQSLADHLEPDGLMVVSFWQFDTHNAMSLRKQRSSFDVHLRSQMELRFDRT
jgi:SAM-dependent methyltransferase